LIGIAENPGKCCIWMEYLYFEHFPFTRKEFNGERPVLTDNRVDATTELFDTEKGVAQGVMVIEGNGDFACAGLRILF